MTQAAAPCPLCRKTRFTAGGCRTANICACPAMARRSGLSRLHAKDIFFATGGANNVVCWPCTGGGPMGKAPTQFGDGAGAAVTTVAANPKLDLLAAGFETGAIILGQPGQDRTVSVVRDGRGPVTALCWNPDGDVHIADFRS